VDPVFKAFYSPYNSMSNKPIIKIDPKGDDDYYNYKGQYLGSDDSKTSKEMRLIKQEDWNSLTKEYKNDDDPFNDLKPPPSALAISKSRIIQFQTVENQELVMKSMENKTANDGKESAGFVLLDVTNAKAYIVEDLNANRFEHHVIRSRSKYKYDDPTTFYLNDEKFDKIIIGGIHTHSQGDNTHGPSTGTNAHNKEYVDTKVASSTKSDEYVIDKDLYRATPSEDTEQLNRPTTQISKMALQTYGSTHLAP
jgi:hypothetical protein